MDSGLRTCCKATQDTRDVAVECGDKQSDRTRATGGLKRLSSAMPVEAGRLGILLIQFPWSPENREYLIDLQKHFREYPLVVEVRHASCLDEHILDLLSELGAGICNIDQPLFGDPSNRRRMSLWLSVTSGFMVVITKSGFLRTRRKGKIRPFIFFG